MQTELNHTVKALFGKASLDDISREDLLSLTRNYPYSSILHFLYSNKLQSGNDLRYPASVSKTALYFSNPHWLHHQLRARTSVEAIAEMEMAYASSQEQERESIQNILPHDPEEKSFIFPETTIESVTHSDSPEEISESVPEQKFTEDFTDMYDVNVSREIEDAEVAPSENDKNNLQDIHTYSDDFVHTETSATSDSFEPEIVMDTVGESQMENIQGSFSETIAEVKSEIPFESSPVTFPAVENQGPKTEETDMETMNVDSIPAEDLTVSNPIQGFMDKTIPDMVNEIKSEGALIPIEPLYAIDYFASQGIRLREEEQQDQLGKKLKSFTEWLKSMKKIHPEKAKSQLDEKTEAAIKTGAEQSNDRAEVLTETMAEVLIKQGLTDQAIEVYEKLSLLNPVKSATFAAKISELKAIRT